MRRTPVADRADDAVLLTSELVTNAIKHGVAPIALDLYCDGESFGVGIQDASHLQPILGRLDAPTNESGRGIALVATIADDWGVRREATGKTVWFKLEAMAA